MIKNYYETYALLVVGVKAFLHNTSWLKRLIKGCNEPVRNKKSWKGKKINHIMHNKNYSWGDN